MARGWISASGVGDVVNIDRIIKRTNVDPPCNTFWKATDWLDFLTFISILIYLSQLQQLSPIVFFIFTLNPSCGFGQLNTTDSFSTLFSVFSVLQVRVGPSAVHTSHTDSFGSRLRTMVVLESTLMTSVSKQSETQSETEARVELHQLLANPFTGSL